MKVHLKFEMFSFYLNECQKSKLSNVNMQGKDEVHSIHWRSLCLMNETKYINDIYSEIMKSHKNGINLQMFLFFNLVWTIPIFIQHSSSSGIQGTLLHRVSDALVREIISFARIIYKNTGMRFRNISSRPYLLIYVSTWRGRCDIEPRGLNTHTHLYTLTLTYNLFLSHTQKNTFIYTIVFLSFLRILFSDRPII